MAKKQQMVLSTTNYALFVLADRNRDLHHCKNLKKSMRDYGWLPTCPAVVRKLPNGCLEIIDGHNRFENAKELGIPVFYVIDEANIDMGVINRSGKRWSLKDFVKSEAKNGNSNYKTAVAYSEASKIPIGLVFAMLAGQSASSQSNQSEKIASGTFEIKDTEHLDAVIDMVEHCKSLGFKANHAHFVRALSRLMFVEEFSPTIFKQRCSANAASLKVCASVDQQTELIESIYNFRAVNGNRVPLAFLAKKTAKERSVEDRHKGRKAK
jgi:hypothetical protein